MLQQWPCAKCQHLGSVPNSICILWYGMVAGEGAWGGGGGAPQTGGGGRLPQVLPDAMGMVCALIAAYRYGGWGTTTGPQRPAPSARQGGPSPPVTQQVGIGVASGGLRVGAKEPEATISPLPAATGWG